MSSGEGGNSDLRRLDALSDGQVDQLVALYQGEGWCRGRERPDVETMLRHSDFVFAYGDAEGRLAAFARVLTDRVFKALVFDVIVRPDCRGTGIGRRILADIAGHAVLAQVRHVELYCRPELRAFYAAEGFADAEGVVLMRRTPGGPSGP